jgi:hypothetical protein
MEVTLDPVSTTRFPKFVSPAGQTPSFQPFRRPRRKVDLFVGAPGTNDEPDIQKVRIALENKSVITAHRNRTNRFDDLDDDLDKVLGAIHSAQPEAL